ncbi:membrane protein [Cryobacterium roopkundense]|uniref:Membrane protein n=1 Tax=Cryobacterium roopkundense TaxID=1001240 RepID=A0A099J2C4_9MICO|nr:membrane protein [Cryobacterium roopkundense]KGJ72205.1 membrane protein [Cryobacterium roopkundense]MBB5641963.1 putative membrane protein [Cryobacterium roopkundense]
MTQQASQDPQKAGRASILRTVGRIALGLALGFAGITHLTVARESFQAQVPAWVPLQPDLVVLGSGAVEIALGIALLVLAKHRVLVGLVVAGFFIIIFPGNISQFTTGTDAFGLNTDRDRFIRLLFQPLLVVWALWSTGAWAALRRWWRRRAHG